MSPNLSSGHFAKNKLLYEQVIYNTLILVGLATTLSETEVRRYATQLQFNISLLSGCFPLPHSFDQTIDYAVVRSPIDRLSCACF